MFDTSFTPFVESHSSVKLPQNENMSRCRLLVEWMDGTFIYESSHRLTIQRSYAPTKKFLPCGVHGMAIVCLVVNIR